MMAGRLVGLSIICAAMMSAATPGRDFSSYRGMQFSMNVPAAAKQAGMNATDARTVHQRPALIQELEWRPRFVEMTDPAKEGMLYFFNGELFRMEITYDSYKVEGMTAEDMIGALSEPYGTATRPAAEIAYHSVYGETAAVLARWENPEYSYNLVRTGDRSSYALVLYSKRINALAQMARTEAVKLEAQEAPRRELEAQRKLDDEAKVALDKARSLNRPNFRP